MNTPEKAADELIDKYRPFVNGTDFNSEVGEYFTNNELWQKSAINCAIIDVTGKIELLQKLHKPEYTTFITEREKTIDGYELVDFWDDVLTNLKSR